MTKRRTKSNASRIIARMDADAAAALNAHVDARRAEADKFRADLSAALTADERGRTMTDDEQEAFTLAAIMHDEHCNLPAAKVILARRRDAAMRDRWQGAASGAQPAWTPFERGTLGEPPPAVIAQLVAASNMTTDDARDFIRRVSATETVWLNSRYQVNRREFDMDGGGQLVHLSIKRRDKAPLGPERFRDLQRIKNELVGPECEGVELYPAESRLVDTANQYHMWVVNDPSFRWPFGYNERLVLGPTEGPARQQPFEGDAAPDARQPINRTEETNHDRT